MKSFVAILALVAVAAADVSHLQQKSADAAAEIIQQEADVGPEGYKYAFQTSNGIGAQESGVLKNAGREDAALEVQGSNQFTAPDGTVIKVDYVANENGYQPQGAHLPTPPAPQEIPEYILRSLEYIRTHAPVEPVKKF